MLIKNGLLGGISQFLHQKQTTLKRYKWRGKLCLGCWGRRDNSGYHFSSLYNDEDYIGILLQSEGSSLNWFVMADTLFKLGSHPANPWGIMRIFIDHLQFYFFICTLYFHRQFLGRMLSRYEALLVVYIVSVRGNVETWRRHFWKGNLKIFKFQRYPSTWTEAPKSYF